MNVIDIFKECNDFKETVYRSKLPAIVVHSELVANGLITFDEYLSFIPSKSEAGYRAEKFFELLIPDAINANEKIMFNNPDFDFVLDGLTIDVKFSSYNYSKKYRRAYWAISVDGRQDITVGFLERSKDSKLDNPICVVVPNYMIKNASSLHFSPTGSTLNHFKVDIKDLDRILRVYVKAKERYERAQ